MSMLCQESVDGVEREPFLCVCVLDNVAQCHELRCKTQKKMPRVAPGNNLGSPKSVTIESAVGKPQTLLSLNATKICRLKAIFHCRSFARADEATDFNLVESQLREHAKKVKCSSTSKRVRAHKSRLKTLRFDTYSKS